MGTVESYGLGAILILLCRTLDLHRKPQLLRPLLIDYFHKLLLILDLEGHNFALQMFEVHLLQIEFCTTFLVSSLTLIHV